MRPALYWVVRVDGDTSNHDGHEVRFRSLRGARDHARMWRTEYPQAKVQVFRRVRSRRVEARARVVEAAKAWEASTWWASVEDLRTAVRALREVEK